MRYRISIGDATQAVSPAPGWVRQRLPEHLGECYSDRFTVGDMSIVVSKYSPTRDIVEQSVIQNESRTLVIAVGIQGESGYLGAEGDALAFRGGHSTVSSFQNSSGERHFRYGQNVSQLRLMVGERALNQYLGAERCSQLLGTARLAQLAFQKTSPSTLVHARALVQSASVHSGDAIDMHFHMLGLLAEQLRFLTQRRVETIRFSERDIEKLEFVRTVMQEHMNRPLSISYLCAISGLNECKLKEGFRFRFNTSPHRMLMELRMRRALMLLESGSQVAEAAYQVGYSHPSNFSAAFTRFFEMPPKSVFGKRRSKELTAGV